MVHNRMPNHPAAATEGAPVTYAVSHRATGPIWVVHTALAAPTRVVAAVRAWGDANAVRIGVTGAFAVAIQTVALIAYAVTA